MACARDILTSKPPELHNLKPENTVLEALELMANKNIGSVVVLSKGFLAGIFTERLYAREVFLKGRASPNTSLGDVMVTNVITATPNTSVEECMAIMNKKCIRHLPIVSKGSVVGMISIGDLMNRIIQDREFDIEQLVDYIGG